MQVKYWRTIDNRKLKIKDMTENHIENCIKYLKRKLKTKPDEIYADYTEDSEMVVSAMICENNYNEDLAEVIENQIKVFKKELSRRKKEELINEFKETDIGKIIT